VGVATGVLAPDFFTALIAEQGLAADVSAPDVNPAVLAPVRNAADVLAALADPTRAADPHVVDCEVSCRFLNDVSLCTFEFLEGLAGFFASEAAGEQEESENEEDPSCH
jgi:hypothetical protein